MRADLHNHTRSSDGVLSPTELVAKAAGRGVSHLAVTDHDTVAGLDEAARAAAEQGIALVPGIEITTELHGRELHLLGLFVVPTAPGLVAFSRRMKDERSSRLRRMTERLAASGVEVSWEDVLEQAADAKSFGRPHLARALVRRGHAWSIQEAFDRFLVPGTPGWLERYRPSYTEAIALVHQAGGVASVAHPGLNGVSKAELGRLAEGGLDAVEAHHPGHPPSQAEAFVRWGRDRGLVATGGTDFHSVEGGHEPGTFLTPAASVRALSEKAERRTAENGLADALAEWQRRAQGSQPLTGAPA